MHCPYCAEQVKDSAIVCKHCSRDLFVVRPLMDKLAAATERLEALEAASPAGPAPTGRMRRRMRASPLPGVEPLSAMTLTFIFLVFAHYLIIVEYSASLIYLRVVSILVPLTFGFFCRESGRPTVAIEFLYGLAVAAASILVMAKVVGKLDAVPVLPRNVIEWREFAEYGASIAFGFFTGAIIRHTVIAMRDPAAKPTWLVERVSRVVSNKLAGGPVSLSMQIIRTLISAVAAAGSGIMSALTGLSQFF